MNEYIYGILSEDMSLCEVLGKIKDGNGEATPLPALYHGYSAVWETYPCICFMQTGCKGVSYADDVCYAKNYTFEFDIFFETGGDKVYRLMDKVLCDNGFVCENFKEIAESVGRRISCVYSYLKEE